MKKKISIIGAGNIGGTLGRRWAAQGHEIRFGVRDIQAERIQILLAEMDGGATAVSPHESVVGADLVLFAVPGRVMADMVIDLGNQLNGKILIDATNNVGQSPMHNLSALRQVAPGSALFRAFSNLGWENFANPMIAGVQADLFYCGDEGNGKPLVHDLIAAVGLRPVYIGGLDQSDLIDALTRLWFVLAMQQGKGRRLIFKMVGV